MSRYIEGTTVFHIIESIEWTEPGRLDQATSKCGATGEPIEADPDQDDLCGNCLSEGDDGGT